MAMRRSHQVLFAHFGCLPVIMADTTFIPSCCRLYVPIPRKQHRRPCLSPQKGGSAFLPSFLPSQRYVNSTTGQTCLRNPQLHNLNQFRPETGDSENLLPLKQPGGRPPIFCLCLFFYYYLCLKFICEFRTLSVFCVNSSFGCFFVITPPPPISHTSSYF